MDLSAPLSRRAAIIAFNALVAAPGLCPAESDEAYRCSLEKERNKADEEFKSAHGPLTLLARFSPRDGKWTVGSDPSCAFVLPGSSAPSRVGEVIVMPGKATLRFAQGVGATAGGKPIRSLDADSQATTPLTATVGELRFHLYFIRDGQLQISVSDPNSVLRREAQPRSWFLVDKRYRIVADWVPYDIPKHVMFLDNDGSSRDRNIPGYATFETDGKKMRMTAILRPENPKPFFVFGDTTNGHETYGAGRFLESDPPKNGKMTLDFNTAHNPLCAYNHEYLCPVAPRENRLSVPIRAGERKYPGNHS